MDKNLSFTILNTVIALFAMSMAALSAYFAHKSNRTTGYLKITANHGEVDVYDITQVPQKNVILEGRLFNAKPPIVRHDHGFKLDIRNTGKYDDQMVKIWYKLLNKGIGEFQSPDPQAIMNMPPQIQERLPFVVPAGQSIQMFWAFNKEEQSISEQIVHVWFETARETIRVKISK